MLLTNNKTFIKIFFVCYLQTSTTQEHKEKHHEAQRLVPPQAHRHERQRLRLDLPRPRQRRRRLQQPRRRRAALELIRRRPTPQEGKRRWIRHRFSPAARQTLGSEQPIPIQEPRRAPITRGKERRDELRQIHQKETLAQSPHTVDPGG